MRGSFKYKRSLQTILCTSILQYKAFLDNEFEKSSIINVKQDSAKFSSTILQEEIHNPILEACEKKFLHSQVLPSLKLLTLLAKYCQKRRQ